MNEIDKMEKFACDNHARVNHFYDDQPYWFHLNMVVQVAHQFKNLIPEDKFSSVIKACWCHDLIEDTRLTYNDVLKATNKEVAEIVYALTNEKGRTRKDRANSNYYYGIRNTPYATFVKLCDRIANIQYSKSKGSGMFEAYKKEHEFFRTMLWTPDYEIMFDYIESHLK